LATNIAYVFLDTLGSGSTRLVFCRNRINTPNGYSPLYIEAETADVSDNIVVDDIPPLAAITGTGLTLASDFAWAASLVRRTLHLTPADFSLAGECHYRVHNNTFPHGMLVLDHQYADHIGFEVGSIEVTNNRCSELGAFIIPKHSYLTVKDNEFRGGALGSHVDKTPLWVGPFSTPDLTTWFGNYAFGQDARINNNRLTSRAVEGMDLTAAVVRSACAVLHVGNGSVVSENYFKCAGALGLGLVMGDTLLTAFNGRRGPHGPIFVQNNQFVQMDKALLMVLGPPSGIAMTRNKFYSVTGNQFVADSVASAGYAVEVDMWFAVPVITAEDRGVILRGNIALDQNAIGTIYNGWRRQRIAVPGALTPYTIGPMTSKVLFVGFEADDGTLFAQANTYTALIAELQDSEP